MKAKSSRCGAVTVGFAGLLLAVGCACSGRAREKQEHALHADEAPATIQGTVIDAASGEPVAGVTVAGPHGTQCVSGRDGRFELGGLHRGDVGELEAHASDGRRARIALRPLSAGRLEVVMRLGAP